MKAEDILKKNTETLTIKHLAPYLPYGLKYKRGNGLYELNKENLIGFLRFDEFNNIRIKPILRPLSDLDKEIEHNGKKFIPYDFWKEVVSKRQWIKICKTISDDYNKIVDMPYWCVRLLYIWHFDVFGLIEKGLAIDINTLEK